MALGCNSCKNIKITIWFILFFAFVFSFNAQGQDPFIPKYDAVKRSERCFTITYDALNQFGAVWFRDKGNFGQDTTLYFVVYMGDKDGNGADGLAFIMHDDPRDTIVDTGQTVDIGGGGTFDLEAATGDDGGGLGYAMHESRVDNNTIPGPHPFYKDNHRIWPSVSIEFDTWDNGDVQDGANNAGSPPVSPYKGWDHTSVVYDGDLYGQQQVIEAPDGTFNRLAPLLPSVVYGNNANVENDMCYAYRIEWIVNGDGTQTLELWVDDYDPNIIDANNYNYQLVMRHTDDMINGVFGGETMLRFGFTGSTGGSRNEQTICLLGGNTRPTAENDYASTPVNTPVVIDVESNDMDFDGDNLFVPTIVKQASNGTATVISVGNDNFINYVPNTNFVGTDTIRYRTCDVDSDKCYALCDEADVIVTVGCDDIFIGANQLTPYTLCSDTLAPDGSAEAFFVSGSLNGNVWVETFTGMNNATVDNGSTAWSFTTNGGCNGGNNIRVQGDRFRVQNTGCEVVWETEDIDISTVTNVNISIFLEANGDMESSDHLEVYYILDGGAEIALTNGIYTDNFGSATASASGLNGSTLKIRVYARNTAGDENYYWDDLYITGNGAGAPPNLTYNWYEGSVAPGNFISNGSTITSLSDTTYYVFATDTNTGCSSDTVSVTISDEPAVVDSIYTIQVSPFTTCSLPYDGALAAGVIEDGDSTTTGYLFEWRYLTDPGSAPIRVGSVANNLEASEYIVTVTNQANGCFASKTDSVTNEVRTPEVFPSVVNDVYSCLINNGEITATAQKEGVPLNSQVGYFWYNGLVADINNPADYIGQTITGLAPGDYAVIVIDSTTMCTSESRNDSIRDLRQNPIPVVTNATDQISCDPNAPTGSFTSAVDNGAGGTTTSGFTFDWYRGLNNVVPARPGYTGGPDVDALVADLYRLIVSNDTSGCEAILDTAIVENIVIPVIDTVVTTDVNVCGPGPNGTITVTPNGNIADFTYRLYSGNGVVPANLITETASNFFDLLDVATYTVTLVDVVTKCESPGGLAVIDDATTSPTADFDITPQYACNPAPPTGRIEANVTTGTPNDYTFEWFVNDTTGAPVLTTTGVNGEILNTLPVGTYALLLTNNATQCQNVYFNVINPNIVLPVVDTAYAVASTFCGTAANGELHATADAGLTDPNIFTFTWTDSIGAVFSLSADTFNVAPGDYELVITNDTTLCMSNPFPVTVIDSTVTPDPDLDVSDNSSCDPTIANGQIEVTDVPNEPTYLLSDYTYIWTDNGTGDTLTAISGASGQIADSLFEGTYRLTIINNVTTCSNQVLSNITDINLKPVINTVSILQHALYCGDPFQSRVAVTSVELIDGTPADTADFDFQWTNLDSSTVLLENDALLEDLLAGGDALPPGNYEVVALNSFGCESVPVTFEILDQSSDPTLALTPVNNTTCNPALPNGLITAEITSGQLPGEVTFAWENTASPGVFLTDTTGTATGQRALSLNNGTYRTYITEKISQCTNSFVANISNTPGPIPLIDTLRTKDIDVCTPPNGEIAYFVDPLDTLPYDGSTNRRYTFYISNDSGVDSLTFDTRLSTDPSNLGEDSVVFTVLAVNTYYAVVVDEYTHCVSPTITTELVQVDGIELTVSKDNLPSGCADASGEITINATSPLNPGPGVGFDIDLIFFNQDISDTLSSATVNNGVGVYSLNTTSLTSGFYAIEATDNVTGCFSNQLTYLESTAPPVTLIDNSTPTTDCNPGNGTIRFTLQDQGTGLPEDFVVHLYSGTLPILANRIDSIQAPLATPWDFTETFTSLKEGTYYIITRSTIDGCFSNDSTVTIDYTGPEPTFSLISTPDSTCIGAAQGTGTLTVNIAGNPDAIYDYTWFTDADTIPGNEFVPALPLTDAEDLFNGMYSLKIEDNDGTNFGLGCKYKVNKQVQKKSKNINIVNAPITPKTDCIPVNGEVHVLEVQEDSDPFITVLGSNYDDFKLYNENLNGLDSTTVGNPDRGNVNDPFSGLDEGKYFVTVRNSFTNCVSNPRQIIIGDSTANPTIVMNLDQPDYSCNGLNPTGILNASATGAVADYSFIWYNGSDTSIVVNIFPPIGGDDRIADSLAAGFNLGQVDSAYTVLVADINGADGNLGCRSKRTMRVPYVSGPIIVTDVITNQTICGPNGAIEISQITERGINNTIDYTGLFTVRMLDNSLNVIDPFANPYATFDPTTGFFSNIPNGTYYTQAQNIVTGCPFGQVNQAVIKDVSQKPVVNITMDLPDFSCSDMAIPTGQLSALAFGGSDNDNVQASFIFTWFDSLGVDITDSFNPAVADSLREGTYTLVVEDNSAVDQFCQRTRTFSVDHQLQEIIIVEADGIDQTWCFPPNGQFWVEGLLVNNVLIDPVTDPVAFSNYTVDLFVTDLNTPLGPDDNTGLVNDPLDSLDENTFFAIAINNTTLCESYPRQFLIYDRSENPVVNLTKLSDNYSLNYDNSNSLTGILEAEAFESDASTKGAAGFSYNWYRNEIDPDSLFNFANGTNAVQNLTNLRDAMYHVEVTSDSTGCVSTAAINLPFVYLKPKFNPVPTAQTFCVPPNGEINIPSIYKVPDSIETFSKYEFDWHIESYDANNPDSVKAGLPDGFRLRGLTAGNHYVHALDTFWMVESDPVQVIVPDSTVFPVIVYNGSLSDDQTSCNPNDPNGALGVNIQPFDTYGFEWFVGQTTSGSTISTTNAIVDRSSGAYTVRVTSQTTGCASNRTFNIVDNIKIPVVVASMAPVTNCIPELANGVANATITNVINSNYDFYWYAGTSATGTPVFSDLAGAFDSEKTNSAYINIPAGFYTIVAQDTFDCRSDAVTIEILENLVYPRITVTEISPLTYCDPDRPNAVMSALADGKTAGFSFQWNVKDGPLYTSGPVVNNLGDQTYTLFVTNNITGCMSLRDVRPNVAYRNVPEPLVEVLNEMTSCISPNGEAIGTILGLLEDYAFTYLEPDATTAITENINGTTISELDINNYFVFATERESGCISDTIMFTVQDGRYVPDFDIITEPSICNEATGSGEVIIADLTRSFEVRWYNDTEYFGTGREIYYKPSGEYYVAVEGTEGCIDSTSAFIGTDLIIYNGVSDNSDGLNDAFYIECIDLFPDNNVKIYNRAGELVYEMEDYDSEDTERSFIGSSNKGPVNGNKLAIGTYFYIIDLKDGSKPRVGYLELNR